MPTRETSPAITVDTAAECIPRGTLAATIIDLDCGIVVCLEGEAGVIGLERMQIAFARVAARRARLAVLDLARLTFMSSLAIGQLVALRRDLDRWNGRLKLAACPPTIHEVLEKTGLSKFFEFHPSVEEAIAANT
jgi:anti-anti-sigma factor